jgi:hypothetical protein
MPSRRRTLRSAQRKAPTKWGRDVTRVRQQVVLFGDPAKPGFYAC